MFAICAADDEPDEAVPVHALERFLDQVQRTAAERVHLAVQLQQRDAVADVEQRGLAIRRERAKTQLDQVQVDRVRNGLDGRVFAGEGELARSAAQSPVESLARDRRAGAGSPMFRSANAVRSQSAPIASKTQNGPISQAKPHSRARSTDAMSCASSGVFASVYAAESSSNVRRNSAWVPPARVMPFSRRASGSFCRNSRSARFGRHLRAIFTGAPVQRHDLGAVLAIEPGSRLRAKVSLPDEFVDPFGSEKSSPVVLDRPFDTSSMTSRPEMSAVRNVADFGRPRNWPVSASTSSIVRPNSSMRRIVRKRPWSPSRFAMKPGTSRARMTPLPSTRSAKSRMRATTSG